VTFSDAERDVTEPSFDPELWIEVAGGRRYLLGKAHTFHGRMRCWDPEEKLVLYYSKKEILKASPAARRWIDGFIAGSEPTLSEYLFITSTEADLLEEDDPLVDEWRQALAYYAETGEMPTDYWKRAMEPIDDVK
jgi:hypothetical protein